MGDGRHMHASMLLGLVDYDHLTNLQAAKKSGRGGEIRTPDILLPKQARYQTTLHPEGLQLYAIQAVRSI